MNFANLLSYSNRVLCDNSIKVEHANVTDTARLLKSGIPPIFYQNFKSPSIFPWWHVLSLGGKKINDTFYEEHSSIVDTFSNTSILVLADERYEEYFEHETDVHQLQDDCNSNDKIAKLIISKY